MVKSRLIRHGLGALRVSGLDSGWQRSVGLAGVEQATDPVMSEVHEPERDPFDSFN